MLIVDRCIILTHLWMKTSSAGGLVSSLNKVKMHLSGSTWMLDYKMTSAVIRELVNIHFCLWAAFRGFQRHRVPKLTPNTGRCVRLWVTVCGAHPVWERSLTLTSTPHNSTIIHWVRNRVVMKAEFWFGLNTNFSSSKYLDNNVWWKYLRNVLAHSNRSCTGVFMLVWKRAVVSQVLVNGGVYVVRNQIIFMLFLFPVSSIRSNNMETHNIEHSRPHRTQGLSEWSTKCKMFVNLTLWTSHSQDVNPAEQLWCLELSQ